MTDEARQQSNSSWWVLVPAAAIAAGIIILALCLRGFGVRIGSAPLPTVDPPTPTEPTQTPIPLPGVWLDPETPAQIALPVAQWVAEHPGKCVMVTSPEQAAVRVGMESSPGATLLWERVYVVAVPYARQQTSLGSAALQERWQTASKDQDPPLWLAEPGSLEALSVLLGPQGEGIPVEIATVTELAARAWAAPDALVFLPFDHLVPRLRPLRIDGYSVLDPKADLARYPLALRVWVQGPADLASPIAEVVRERSPLTNRNPEHLGTIATTGVTAMTRMTAWRMDEEKDPGYAARAIGPLLSSADVTHISNEVSFVDGCVPQKVMSGFCSRPAYTQALRLLGTDVVELTGNHNLDFGPAPALASLEMYEHEGMQVFGGGQDEEAARQPLVVTVKGTRVVFLGYNQAGPPQAWASADQPGAAHFDLDRARQDIAAAHSQADVVMVHVQHTETYSTLPGSRQRLDFLALAEAGADVVVGTQAHQPQGVEFHGDSLILYGLGNLIFDQMWSRPTRQSLVAWHLLYEGRHLATELLPTQTDDYAQPHWLQGAEARAVLDEVFAASYWGNQ